MKNICNVSEPKIGEILHNLNIHISSGSISNILIKKKDRLTIIELLQNGSELKYCLNQEAIGIAGQLGVAPKYIQPLKQLQSGQEYQKQPFVELLAKGIPDVKDCALVKILEASAIACYHKGLTHPGVNSLYLLCSFSKT